MFSTGDPLTQGAMTALICVGMGTCLVVWVALFRRWQQTHHDGYLESIRSRYRPLVVSLLAGTGTREGIDILRRLPLAELEVLFEPLFVEGIGGETQIAPLLTLCAELQLIDRWQKRLRSSNDHGRVDPAGNEEPQRRTVHASGNLLQRAKGIRNLGMLRHQPSWRLLVEALDDAQSDIQCVALRSLASIRARDSFPVLVERLREVVLGDLTAPPLKVLQSTLASFGTECSSDLLPLLRHENRKLRWLAVDILRGMTYRSAARDPNFFLGPQLLANEVADLLVTELCRDASAEVRGPAGEVIAFLQCPAATTVLYDLLFDPQWYVRLRTMRALAHPRHSNALLILGMRECLDDSDWRVREAAITTLIALGDRGRQELYASFLSSHDRAPREQIVELLERQGFMARLIARYGEGAHGLETLMVEQLADGAAPRGFPAALCMSPPATRQKFQERFLPYALLKMRLQGEATSRDSTGRNRQRPLDFPPVLAA